MLTSTKSTLSNLPSLLATTCSPPCLTKRDRRDLVTRCQQAPRSKSQRFSMTPTSPHPSTGELPVESTPSRTKDNVVHAGPSVPPALLSSLTGKLPTPSSASPSNKLFLAQSKTMAAKVDGKLKPSITSRIMDRSWSLLTSMYQVPPKPTRDASMTNL